MPLGVAFMKAVMHRKYRPEEVRSRLFVYPDRLIAALKDSPSDSRMLSNYA